MTGTQTLIVILSVTALICSGWCFQMWLRFQSECKKINRNLEASKQETARFRIFTDGVLTGQLSSQNRVSEREYTCEMENERLLQVLNKLHPPLTHVSSSKCGK